MTLVGRVRGAVRDRGPARDLLANRPLVAVLVLGLIVRAALIPITNGQDFVVWDLAARGTLDGTNVYAHHPDYPVGPFAYFPLFLYVELPFRWVALHGLGSFVVWGKLPILAADLWCATLIAAELRDRGARAVLVAAGVAAFFLNPLVLYNGAYYGRFDTLGCALLLAALRSLRRHGSAGRRWPWWYALGVAAKSFPAFVLLAFLRAAAGSRARLLAVCVVVLVGLSLPYLGAPHPFVHDLVVYDLTKHAQGLSWQYLLTSPLGAHRVRLVGYVLLVAFVAVAAWLARIEDLWLSTAATLVAFLVTSKLVLEQYLLWPMAMLIVLAVTSRTAAGRASGVLVAAFTVLGMLGSEDYHPFGRESWVGVLVSVTSAAYAGVVLWSMRRGADGQPPRLVAEKVSHRVGSPLR